MSMSSACAVFAPRNGLLQPRRRAGSVGTPFEKVDAVPRFYEGSVEVQSSGASHSHVEDTGMVSPKTTSKLKRYRSDESSSASDGKYFTPKRLKRERRNEVVCCQATVCGTASGTLCAAVGDVESPVRKRQAMQDEENELKSPLFGLATEPSYCELQFGAEIPTWTAMDRHLHDSSTTEDASGPLLASVPARDEVVCGQAGVCGTASGTLCAVVGDVASPVRNDKQCETKRSS